MWNNNFHASLSSLLVHYSSCPSLLILLSILSVLIANGVEGSSNSNSNTEGERNDLLTNEFGLKYVWGDALMEPNANGPDGNPYPWERAAKIAAKQRSPRFFSDGGSESPQLLSPQQTRDILLKAFQAQERGDFLPGTSFMPPSYSSSGQSDLDLDKNNNKKMTGNVGQNRQGSSFRSHRQGRAESISMQGNKSSTPSTFSNALPSRQQSSASHNKNSHHNNNNSNKRTDPLKDQMKEPEGCVPSRLCPSTYNTTAPLYGVSLTSGQPVTIVQKFPDLLQQVVFQVCKTTECEVLQGECVQTYLPYLFLVIPLGPVTLTGQDYVLVESGCVCRPKYARRYDEPPPLPFIQPLQN